MAKKTKPARKKSAGLKRPNGHDTLREVEQLLYRQAECLDGKRWQDFIELFTEDGTYWMPAEPGQITGDGSITLRRPLTAERSERSPKR